SGKELSELEEVAKIIQGCNSHYRERLEGNDLKTVSDLIDAMVAIEKYATTDSVNSIHSQNVVNDIVEGLGKFLGKLYVFFQKSPNTNQSGASNSGQSSQFRNN